MNMLHTALLAAAASVASAIMVSPSARADAHIILRDRSHLLALDARCSLLDAPAREALDAGRLQARGALARAGVSIDELDSAEAAASRSADAIACGSPEATTLAANAANAFEAWRGLQQMEFPARHRGWRAARADRYEIVWMIRQDIAWGQQGRVIFGLAAVSPEPALALYVDGGARAPQAARLFVRDPSKADTPMDMNLVRLLASPSADDMTLHAVPDAFTTTYWASRRANGAEAEAFGGESAGREAAIFLFPLAALQAFEALDATETVAAEFDISGADGSFTTERVLIEAGDFRAARVFAQPSAVASAEP